MIWFHSRGPNPSIYGIQDLCVTSAGGGCWVHFPAQRPESPHVWDGITPSVFIPVFSICFVLKLFNTLRAICLTTGFLTCPCQALFYNLSGPLSIQFMKPLHVFWLLFFTTPFELSSLLSLSLSPSPFLLTDPLWRTTTLTWKLLWAMVIWASLLICRHQRQETRDFSQATHTAPLFFRWDVGRGKWLFVGCFFFFPSSSLLHFQNRKVAA